MDDAREKLAVLLPYWIDHNREHEKEIRDWADAMSASRPDVADLLQKCVARMEEATMWLEKARQGLDES